MDITVSAHVVPFSRHHQVALQVDQHDQDHQFPEDTWQDTDVLGVASWTRELGQSNKEVKAADQSNWGLSFLVALKYAESRT